MTLESLLNGSESRSEIKDKLSLRIHDCLSDLREKDHSTTNKDLAILIRQWIRRKDLNSDKFVGLHRIPVEICELLNAELASCGLEKHKTVDGGVALTAKPWIPDWVRGSSEKNPVDQSSGEFERRSACLIETEKAFRDLTGYQFYKSKGQFAACQVVRSMKNGSATVVMLPTGSGKTEVALSMIENLANVHPRMRDKASIVSVLVVPYVSLIKDLDRRLVDLYKKRWRSTGTLTFSYTYDTDSSQLESLLNRINFPDDSEIPGIIITSPESFVGRFRNELRNWARSGRIGSLIFDEAHLLYQSGVGFRLDFRELPSMRSELSDISPDGCKPRVLLMSATIGEVELRYLVDNFGPIENIGLVDAASSRSEPDIFVSKRLSSDKRAQSLYESLHNLPRPLIIYVTRPADAKDSVKLLKEWGFGRVRCVVGDTSSVERDDVLRSLRTGESRSKCDVVVANSAFGLGIDCDEIRSVIHYCLPESVDRWYQEIGRGGRDGKSSVGLLITEGQKNTTDWLKAQNNIPKSLLIETLTQRWKSMTTCQEISQFEESRILLDPRTPPTARYRRNWNESNGYTEYGLTWNRTILYALEQMGLIELFRPNSKELEQIRNIGSTHFDWVVIKKKFGFDLTTAEFAEQWSEFRTNLSKPFEDQLERMFKISNGEISPCSGIKNTYEMPDELVERFKPCLQAESCKDDCGHCSYCFDNQIERSGSYTLMPFMSVVKDKFVDRSINTFVEELQGFWMQMTDWRHLTKPDVQILPIAQFQLDEDQSRIFEKLLQKNQFWIYGENCEPVGSDFLSTIRPQLPGPTLLRSNLISGGLVKTYFRKESFRNDLGVPLILLDINSSSEIDFVTSHGSSLLDWQIPLHFDWINVTTKMIKKLVSGGFN